MSRERLDHGPGARLNKTDEPKKHAQRHLSNVGSIAAEAGLHVKGLASRLWSVIMQTRDSAIKESNDWIYSQPTLEYRDPGSLSPW